MGLEQSKWVGVARAAPAPTPNKGVATLAWVRGPQITGRSRRQFCLKRERLKWRKGYNRTIRGSLQLVVREIVLGGPEEDGEKEREKLRRLAGPNRASKPGWESRDNRLALMERRGGLVEYDSNIPHLIGENWAGNCEGIVHHEYDELNGMDLGGPGNKRRV